MKGITLCADCAYYSMKKHKCTRGAIDEGGSTARFYADCPLDDVAPVVLCKDCRFMEKLYSPSSGQFCGNYCAVWGSCNGEGDDGFCNYGERKDNDRF